MDINLLREIVTVASFTVFIGIVVYAAHPRNRARFEAAGRQLLEDEPSPQPGHPHPDPLPRERENRGEGANVGRGCTKSEHQ